jgi:hypothetical protein
VADESVVARRAVAAVRAVGAVVPVAVDGVVRHGFGLRGGG